MPLIPTTIQPELDELPEGVDATTETTQTDSKRSDDDSIPSHVTVSDQSPTPSDFGDVSSQHGQATKPVGHISPKYRTEDVRTIAIPQNVLIPGRSPTPSEFGSEFGADAIEQTKTHFLVGTLPYHIQEYMHKKSLEAYFVRTDGDCLFSAVTFDPEFKKKDLTRQGMAGFVEGIFHPNHDLSNLVSEGQLENTGIWQDDTLGEQQLRALAEQLRIKIIVHNFYQENVPQTEQIYGPKEGTQLLWEKPVQVLLWNYHYYPVFKAGTFPKTTLPHQRGFEFIPGKSRKHRGSGVSEESAGGIIATNGPSRSDHEVQDAIGKKPLPEGTNKHIKEVSKETSVASVSAAVQGETLLDLASTSGTDVIPPPEEPSFGQKLLKGLGWTAGGAAVVALGVWLYNKFVKEPQETQGRQARPRVLRKIDDPDEESDGDLDEETSATAEW